MSKYDKLWEHISKKCENECALSFDEVKNILGFPIDHSFLQYKKELIAYGFCVKKISLKMQTVYFEKLK